MLERLHSFLSLEAAGDSTTGGQKGDALGQALAKMNPADLFSQLSMERKRGFLTLLTDCASTDSHEVLAYLADSSKSIRKISLDQLIVVMQGEAINLLFLRLIDTLAKKIPGDVFAYLRYPRRNNLTIGQLIVFSQNNTVNLQFLKWVSAWAAGVLDFLVIPTSNKSTIGHSLACHKNSEVNQLFLDLLGVWAKEFPIVISTLLAFKEDPEQRTIASWIAEKQDAEVNYSYSKLLIQFNGNLRMDYVTQCKIYFVADKLLKFILESPHSSTAKKMAKEALTNGSILNAIFKLPSRVEVAYQGLHSVVRAFKSPPESNLTQLQKYAKTALLQPYTSNSRVMESLRSDLDTLKLSDDKLSKNEITDEESDLEDSDEVAHYSELNLSSQSGSSAPRRF